MFTIILEVWTFNISISNMLHMHFYFQVIDCHQVNLKVILSENHHLLVWQDNKIMVKSLSATSIKKFVPFYCNTFEKPSCNLQDI